MRQTKKTNKQSIFNLVMVLGRSASTAAADYDRLRQCETWRSDWDRLGREGRIPTFFGHFHHFALVLTFFISSCFNFQGGEVSIVPFTTMRHGFLTRGNMEDPEVAAEVLFSSIFVFNKWEKHVCQHRCWCKLFIAVFVYKRFYPTTLRCQGLWTLLWTSSRSTLENNR